MTPSDFHIPLPSIVPFAHSHISFTHGCIYPTFPGSSATSWVCSSFMFPVNHNFWSSRWVHPLDMTIPNELFSGYLIQYRNLRVHVYLIIIIIIIIISFMQSIYTYIPETNYVPTEYSAAAILLLLYMVLISLVSVLNLLYFYISTFRSMCAVPNMAVFCSSLTSCFPGTLLTYFLNDFEKVPVAPIITVSSLLLHSTCTVFLL